MTERARTAELFYLLTTGAGCILAAFFWGFSLLSEPDPHDGYLHGNAYLIALALMTVTVLLLLTRPLVMRGEYDSVPVRRPLTRLTALLSAVGTIFFSIGFFGLSSDMARAGIRTAEIAARIAAVAAIPGVLYLLLSAVILLEISSLRALCGMSLSVSMTAAAATLYFEPDMALNAPQKMLPMVALLSLSLFFLSDTRFSLGNAKYRSFHLTANIATLFTAVTATGAFMYLTATGEFTFLNGNFYFPILAFFLYVFARSVSTVRPEVPVLSDDTTEEEDPQALLQEVFAPVPPNEPTGQTAPNGEETEDLSVAHESDSVPSARVLSSAMTSDAERPAEPAVSSDTEQPEECLDSQMSACTDDVALSSSDASPDEEDAAPSTEASPAEDAVDPLTEASAADTASTRDSKQNTTEEA